MEITEVITAHGHMNIRATHKTTFEITKDDVLTKRGDCIIAVNATKGASALCQEFKEKAKSKGSRITILIDLNGLKEVVKAEGSPRLSFLHPTDLVVRKSCYVCNRTVAIRADKAASDFSRKLVKKLLNPDQRVKITFMVKK